MKEPKPIKTGRAKTWLALMLVFISGVIIGVVGTMLVVRSMLLQILSGDFQRVGHIIVQRIDSKLDLNPTQLEAVKTLVRSAQAEIALFRELHRPEMEKILSQHAEKINALLDPSQKIKFAQMVANFKKIHSFRKK